LTDERLAELRQEWRSRVGIEQQGIFAAHHVPDLLDEVERLGSVVDDYKEVIELHHADFLKIKKIASDAVATWPTETYTHGVFLADALREIDRIVR
jgi:hypothetical protein